MTDNPATFFSVSDPIPRAIRAGPYCPISRASRAGPYSARTRAPLNPRARRGCVQLLAFAMLWSPPVTLPPPWGGAVLRLGILTSRFFLLVGAWSKRQLFSLALGPSANSSCCIATQARRGDALSLACSQSLPFGSSRFDRCHWSSLTLLCTLLDCRRRRLVALALAAPNWSSNQTQAPWDPDPTLGEAAARCYSESHCTPRGVRMRDRCFTASVSARCLSIGDRNFSWFTGEHSPNEPLPPSAPSAL